jgi:hypothetical protein
MMSEFINNNLFQILSLIFCIGVFYSWVKVKINDLQEKIIEAKRINDNRVLCDKHSSDITKLKDDNNENKVFQAKILAELKNINDKIELTIAPLQKAIEEIKKKLEKK